MRRLPRRAVLVGGIALAVVCAGLVAWWFGPYVIDEALGGARCGDGPASPIAVNTAQHALESVGYTIRRPDRADGCIGNTVAQLDDTSAPDEYKLYCYVKGEPVLPERVVTLPDTAGGAVNLGAGNVQCLAYTADDQRERDRIARALQRMLDRAEAAPA